MGESSAVVDIVLATNRAGRYLSATLDSVADQTHPAWNLFVVDDGSSDPGLIEAVLAGRPNVTLTRQPASGVSAARNAGLALGAAELVVFLDDDDVWAPDRLERQVAALEAAPDAVACYTGGNIIDAEGASLGGWEAHPATSAAFLDGSEPLPRIVTLMTRRAAAVRAGGFDTRYAQAEDHDFILRLAQEGPMVAVEERLVFYRRHPGNVSSSRALDGRSSSRALLLRQIGSTEAQGRSDVADLLRANLARQVPLWAEDNLRQLKAHVRHRDVRQLMGEIAWLLTRDPRPMLVLILRRVRGTHGRRRS